MPKNGSPATERIPRGGEAGALRTRGRGWARSLPPRLGSEAGPFRGALHHSLGSRRDPFVGITAPVPSSREPGSGEGGWGTPPRSLGRLPCPRGSHLSSQSRPAGGGAGRGPPGVSPEPCAQLLAGQRRLWGERVTGSEVTSGSARGAQKRCLGLVGAHSLPGIAAGRFRGAGLPPPLLLLPSPPLPHRGLQG